MSMLGQKRSQEICIRMLKINKPKVIRSTFYFLIGIEKVELVTLLP